MGIGQGDVLRTESLCMECIYPLQEQEGLTGNASSLVMTVESEDFCGLFTGDLETEGEKQLLTAYMKEGSLFGQKKCDFLKVAQHGSSTSTSYAFLQWLQPEYAGISCGENNRYGHPHTEVLLCLKTEGIPYLITYEEGAVNWSTDSPRPWLQSDR